MAGVAGFEPAHDGIKTRCLTAWRHPIILSIDCEQPYYSTSHPNAEDNRYSDEPQL